MDAFGPEFTRECVTKGVHAGATVLYNAMKANAPVLSAASPTRVPGELRDSIDALMTPFNQDKPSVVSAKISPTYEKREGTQSPGYWCRFVEYGSVHNPVPEPFMRPAIDQEGKAAIEECISATAAALEAGSGGKATVAEGES